MENAIVPSANVGNSEGASVDHVTEREFKVELHDLGISPKDIKAVRRIEVRLVERSRNARQAAAQAGPSAAQVTTRAKGKQRALSIAELEEQLNKLREEELWYNAMHQHIQARMVMLEQEQAPRSEPTVAWHNRRPSPARRLIVPGGPNGHLYMQPMHAECVVGALSLELVIKWVRER